MAKITGIVRIKVNGALMESLPEAELDLGGNENEPVVGHALYGSRAKVMPAMLTFTIVWKAGTPIEDLRNLFEGTATFESDVGETYVITNCTIGKTIKVKGGSGEVDVECFGNPAVPA